MTENRWVLGVITIALLMLMSIGVSLGADWAGKYLTEDSKDHAFTITLSRDGKATGEKHGTVLKGTWSADSGAAVIKWTTGWTTKLSHDGDGYIKTAFRPGTPMTEKPTSTVAAKKVD